MNVNVETVKLMGYISKLSNCLKSGLVVPFSEYLEYSDDVLVYDVKKGHPDESFLDDDEDCMVMVLMR